MKQFSFVTTARTDDHKVSVEINYGDEEFAFISQESGEFEIYIYPHLEGKYWKFNVEKFQTAIEYAKKCLLKKKDMTFDEFVDEWARK